MTKFNYHSHLSGKLLPILILSIVFVVFSCQKEQMPDALDEEIIQTDDFAKLGSKAGKIDICHYSDDDDTWHVINVNENAWDAHEAHGDVRLDDQDDDGFVPYNECGFGEMGDCDDLNPGINPAAQDILCDGIDQDCDGADAEYEEQFWFNLVDNDGDDWYVYIPENDFLGTCPPGNDYYRFEDAIQLAFDDCDDTNAAIYPDSPEICGDGLDNDCNGFTDFIPVADVSVNGTDYYFASGAYFGPYDPARGEWSDVIPNSLGCSYERPVNDLTGKVALIDRGDCFFVEKTTNAQALDAVAVIICNNNDEIFLMSAPDDYPDPSITTVMLSSSDCENIRLNPGVVEILPYNFCDVGARSSSAKSEQISELQPEFQTETLKNGLVKKSANSTK